MIGNWLVDKTCLLLDQCTGHELSLRDGNEARHLLHANELARMRREGISLPLNHDGTADLAELESVGPPPKPRYFRAGSIIPKKDTYRSSSKLMYKDTYTLYVYIDPESFSAAGGYAYLDDTISYNSTHEDKAQLLEIDVRGLSQCDVV
ncbi:hypothetical protein FOZ60_006157 [Perkinsus olseni]|uniref:Uncharacterized protein n=1 Tax=Perkinsus olseni TaxID=32597 RepID=A0A7J6PFY3_PEROL|nr:hypothetical protein FOZ60_006157 [Perkinsus olseni]